MRAWLLLSLKDYGSFAEHDGYDDLPDSHYSWDSTVPNHGNVSVGDLIILWDGKASIGLSIIDEINKDPRGNKKIYSCPKCEKSKIQVRKTRQPAYICHACGHEFDTRRCEETPVTNYRSSHQTSWNELKGKFSANILRSVCISPKSQLSIREINWILFFSLLADTGNTRILTELSSKYLVDKG
ncbi:hypothetical protein [Glutamicibacter ardleyensis]|uniref:hypothetical protein n=1 Tax=Glutamicibacter ardleyensis TaxID=225894 RepID=UPI003FCF12CF